MLPSSEPGSDIAGLILLCPNLGRLSGPNPPFTPGRTNPIHTALATREKLEEQLWYITSIPGGEPHERWTGLRSLVLDGELNSSPLPAALFSQLPALRKLMVSSFDASAFTDETLLSLPAGLTHLRLSRLAGITDEGLSSYCHRTQLLALTLEHLPLAHLTTVATILDSQPTLRRFALHQLSLPGAAELASDSLEHLHWHIPTLDPNHHAATTALARSMTGGRMPALRTLCAPSDDGTLRVACTAAPREYDWMGWRGSGGLWSSGWDGGRVEFLREGMVRVEDVVRGEGGVCDARGKGRRHGRIAGGREAGLGALFS